MVGGAFEDRDNSKNKAIFDFSGNPKEVEVIFEAYPSNKRSLITRLARIQLQILTLEPL